MSARIDSLWPVAASDLDDEALLGLYAPPPGSWLRMNFVSSLDGAATRGGQSAGLGDDADRRVFELARRHADAVLVGAGTARAEGYGAMVLSGEAQAWRAARGMTRHPVVVLVSASLHLDPGSPIFADAPVRPIVYTVAGAPAGPRTALAAVADVVEAGRAELDPLLVRADLADRGLVHIHAEGGPSLFGAFLAAGAVDELLLTLAPTLEGGSAGRIAHGPDGAPTPMALAGVLRAGDELLLRYRRSD
jgi:riboflavin biosynthesis pyrimidine reductase